MVPSLAAALLLLVLVCPLRLAVQYRFGLQGGQLHTEVQINGRRISLAGFHRMWRRMRRRSQGAPTPLRLAHTVDRWRWVLQGLSRAECRLRLQTHDAALTAVGSAVLWTAAGLIMRWMHRQGCAAAIIRILPTFEVGQPTVDVYCVFGFRLGCIMIRGLQAFFFGCGVPSRKGSEGL